MKKANGRPRKFTIPIQAVTFTEGPEVAKERYAMLDNLCTLFAAYIRKEVNPGADNFLHLGRTAYGDVAISITWDKEKKP